MGKGFEKRIRERWKIIGMLNKTCWEGFINNERPTGKKHTNVGRDDGGKIGKIIN